MAVDTITLESPYLDEETAQRVEDALVTRWAVDRRTGQLLYGFRRYKELEATSLKGGLTMGKTSRRSERVSLRLTKGMTMRLDRIAVELGVTRAEAATYAVGQFVRQMEGQDALLQSFGGPDSPIIDMLKETTHQADKHRARSAEPVGLP